MSLKPQSIVEINVKISVYIYINEYASASFKQPDRHAKSVNFRYIYQVGTTWDIHSLFSPKEEDQRPKGIFFLHYQQFFLMITIK